MISPAEILGALKRPASMTASTDANQAAKRMRQDTPYSSVGVSHATTPKTEDTAASKPRAAPKSAIPAPKPVPAAPTDIYDAMLGEISDLLMAAQQAQALGRLKMASTYQLLVHARLVGLGKRFDRFLAHGQTNLSSKTSAERSLSFPPISSKEPAIIISDAQVALAKILPSDVDLDNTMMEHLARAAMELHNKRTGRGMLHEKSEAKKTSNGGVAWTAEEKDRCLQAAEKHGRDQIEAIVGAVGSRTEAEVRAHLKNVSGREKVERHLASTGVKKGSAEDSSAEANEDSKDAGDELVTPEKVRRGRGKKPPSKAMLTMPSGVFDAKKMVSGGL